MKRLYEFGRTWVSETDVDLSVTTVVEAGFWENGDGAGDILLLQRMQRRMRDDS
jgi:hypothetical protein